MNGGRRVDLIGLGFDPVTMAQVIETCVGWCREPRQSHTVVTANASHLCAMRRDPELARACSVGDLVVADGMSVVWASRWAGDEFPDRVAGVDLMTLLLEVASRLHLRAYFLGERPDMLFIGMPTPFKETFDADSRPKRPKVGGQVRRSGIGPGSTCR